ncbi:TetR/AcrR family transcriptional regulator [Ruminiclostridium cellobioparum]|uniref:Transcriptional regulator n=1 Tax=Ruminiclostridium cellobioparum subsp. termitidis CT1112 TaxID=1195236 RepID=S0FV64_RUMCE|nr:helix-turn-helix domain-containing protein [Ruminiclostridium cellobioparum]EMS74171.1 Transcriptional regulator [Ruminiclostridium cellobioparum subsp. termitidis CT1112]
MENRMRSIFDAASHLFINKGYAGTQIKDIAKEIGLSTGMLYVYFTGKRDILNFILKGTIDQAFITQEFELPISSELFDSLDNEIMNAFEENTKAFSSHLDNITEYPLEQMLSDAFEVISKYGIGCLLIEKNPDDLRKLTVYYKEYRKKFYDQVLSYITQYMQIGTFRHVEHPQHITRLIIETLSWWGMHITNDAYEIQKDIPIETAKAICMDNLLHAYQL